MIYYRIFGLTNEDNKTKSKKEIEDVPPWIEFEDQEKNITTLILSEDIVKDLLKDLGEIYHIQKFGERQKKINVEEFLNYISNFKKNWKKIPINTYLLIVCTLLLISFRFL